MNPEIFELKERLRQICRKWFSQGLPSQEGLESTAEALTQWKRYHNISGLWPIRPLMVTATIDDGIGQGVAIIERYARVMGLLVKHIGLLQDPDAIVHQCRQMQPDVLGLTVLQLDSDEALAKIGCNLPAKTCLIAGGPVFKYDSEMARRCNVDYVAANVAYFVEYMLDWHAQGNPSK